MNKIVFSAGYMFVVSLIFVCLVSFVKLANEDKIERNQQVKLQKTILNCLGIGENGNLTPEDIVNLFEKRIVIIKHEKRNFYKAYEDDGKTIMGYAFPVSGPGFWGPVYGMVAVNPEADRILGISFYRHSETPGLGGRISEDWFTVQFKGLPIYPIEGGEKIFYLSPPKDNKLYNDLDAITGASRTSEAVERFLNREIDLFLRDFRKVRVNE